VVTVLDNETVVSLSDKSRRQNSREAYSAKDKQNQRVNRSGGRRKSSVSADDSLMPPSRSHYLKKEDLIKEESEGQTSDDNSEMR
jgi:hypothetical protein